MQWPKERQNWWKIMTNIHVSCICVYFALISCWQFVNWLSLIKAIGPEFVSALKAIFSQWQWICLVDVFFSSEWTLGVKTSNWRQPSNPPTPEWSTIMSRGENGVPLKSVLNQTQLIPLLSLIISTIERVLLVSLLTRDRAPAEVMLSQAK